MIGKVKVIKEGGYGFITAGQEDFFFHADEYKGDFANLKLISPPYTEEGPLVQFKVVDHKKGPRAMSIELIDEIT